MATAKPIPEGYRQVTPYLCVDGAITAIDFYGEVFGATERMRMPEADGKIGHAELQIGDSVIMLSDEYPEMGIRSPKAIGGSPVTMSVYVEDVDSVFDRAVKAGAKTLRPVEDQFYGDRSGQFEDPSGTAGVLPPTSRTCRLKKWRSVWLRDRRLRRNARTLPASWRSSRRAWAWRMAVGQQKSRWCRGALMITERQENT